MARIKKVRQILKGLADDLRLRIVTLLSDQPLNVSELYQVLGSSQSNISKHLSRLRLTGIVNDKRKGSMVYYHLISLEDKIYKKLINSVTSSVSTLDVFKKDRKRLEKIRK